ncbi:MAG: helix-turn-helix transcriptional regulator [Verrucomicrobiota bacterium]
MLISLQRAVTPEDVWLACDKLMGAALPLNHCLLGLQSIGIVPAFLRTTLPVPDTEGYFGRLAELAPLKEVIVKNPRKKVGRLSDTFSLENPSHQMFLREFMEPGGWRYSAAMLFWNPDGSFIGQFAITRAETQGDVTDAEMELLERLHPHVEAAFQRLVIQEGGAAVRLSFEHALDSLPLPVAIVGWNLCLDYCNDSACEALHIWLHGTKRARELKRGQHLPEDLRGACAAIRAGWEEANRLDDFTDFESVQCLTCPGKENFRAVVRLVEPQAGRTLQPAFIIELHLPPEANPEVTRALLQLSLLTTSEREVARLAASGHHNVDIAARLSVSVNTVRSHLRNAFAKLGISSRSSLAPLYHVLATPNP